MHRAGGSSEELDGRERRQLGDVGGRISPVGECGLERAELDGSHAVCRRLGFDEVVRADVGEDDEVRAGAPVAPHLPLGVGDGAVFDRLGGRPRELFRIEPAWAVEEDLLRAAVVLQDVGFDVVEDVGLARLQS